MIYKQSNVCVRLAIAALLLSTSLIGLTAPPSSAATVNSDRFPTEEAFIDQIYRDFLSRGPDPAGLAYWADQIRSGSPPEQVVEDLLLSPEFQGTTAPIVRLYQSIFDRLPDLVGLRFWVSKRAAGDSLETIAEQFLLGAEFEELAAAESTEQIVSAVYGRTLGRAPDADGLAFWTAEVESGRLSLAGFVVTVSESVEHRQLRSGEVETTLVYLGLLQRLPEPAGLSYWSAQLRSGLRIRDLAGLVMSLPGYQNRFPVAPAIQTDVVATGLRIPWGLASLPDGSLLVSERPGGLMLITPNGSQTDIDLDLSDLFVNGETGMMGLAVDPDFAANRRFYSCQGHHDPREIQVIAWTLDAERTSATRINDPLVGGIPLGTGRHGGCQLEFGADGSLYVGTGDAAQGNTPQDLASLGGKVLRVDPMTGAAASGNPFLTSSNPNTRLIYSYGHRNVQGLGVHPQTGQVWSIEHGPNRDDEITRLQPGGNAGWNPVPGYNESVPMSDPRLPHSYPANYRTGSSTLALSGGAWVDNSSWGPLDGALGVAALKDQTFRIFFFNSEGLYLGQRVLVDGEFGRLRAVHQTPGGDLYISTSTGDDRIIRLSAES